MSILFGTNRIHFFLRGCNPLFLVKLFHALLVSDRHGSYGIAFSHILSLSLTQRVIKFTMSFGISLDYRSISYYLLHVRTLVNVPSSIGEPVSNSKHLNLILDGLPDEYESSILLITSRFDPFSIDEVETLLPAREVHNDCSRKCALGSINLTQSLGSITPSQGCSGSLSHEGDVVSNSVQSVNPNSQGQVNLTTQSASENNSPMITLEIIFSMVLVVGVLAGIIVRLQW